MQSVRIVKIEATIDRIKHIYELQENGLYRSNRDQSTLGLYDFLCEGGSKITEVLRTSDNLNIRLNSTVRFTEDGRQSDFVINKITFNQNRCVLIDSDDEYITIEQVVNPGQTVRQEHVSVTITTNTLPETVTNMQTLILANNPRAIRLRGVLKNRRETLDQFLVKFFKGVNGSAAFNSKETIYVDDESVQTPANRRRSLGDIFMICRYYYPDCTLQQVIRVLTSFTVNNTSNPLVRGFRTSMCNQIHKRVYYYDESLGLAIHNTTSNDEYGKVWSFYTNLRTN